MVLLVEFLLFVILRDHCQLVLIYDANVFFTVPHLRNKTGLIEMMSGTNIQESKCHLKRKLNIIFLKLTHSKDMDYYNIKSGFGE